MNIIDNTETLNDFINRLIDNTTTNQTDADRAYNAYASYRIAISTLDRICPAANIIATITAATITATITHNPIITTTAALTADIAPAIIYGVKAHKQNKIFAKLTGGNLRIIFRNW